MKTLLKNAQVVNVFTDSIENADVLIDNDRIIGVGDYSTEKADHIENLDGAFVCPGFIDGHIHIESTMLTPFEFVRAALPHGTVGVVTDPHEIANVCGLAGIDYMMADSEDLPMDIMFMVPSCVPASCFDESGAEISPEDITPYYSNPRVLGLAEMMNYPGVVNGDPTTCAKVQQAMLAGMIVNGHAPGLSGASLDKYIAAGIQDDHECVSFLEAREKMARGQWIMVRQGSVARNLAQLMPLFEEPYNRRCLLVSDDLMPGMLFRDGHIDRIIRETVAMGANPVVAIRMATLQAAQAFGLTHRGAIAPGYQADILVLDDKLERVRVRDVYKSGKLVVSKGCVKEFEPPCVSGKLLQSVNNTVHVGNITPQMFIVDQAGTKKCNVIGLVSGELISEHLQLDINFDSCNGVDLNRDIAKIAVIERHHNTGHVGLGYVKGFGLYQGALASSVSHDSHNIIVVGADEQSMSLAAQTVCEMGGGCAVVSDGKVLEKIALPVAGLMSTQPIDIVADADEALHSAAEMLGANKGTKPLMDMTFMSLPVIPSLKLTSQGLVDVDAWQRVPLVVE